MNVCYVRAIIANCVIYSHMIECDQLCHLVKMAIFSYAFVLTTAEIYLDILDKGKGIILFENTC